MTDETTVAKEVRLQTLGLSRSNLLQVDSLGLHDMLVKTGNEEYQLVGENTKEKDCIWASILIIPLVIEGHERSLLLRTLLGD